MGQWTLFSNHGHVLVSLALSPKARLRDVAAEVGITERAVQKIIQDLAGEGYLEIRRQGRRNQYRVNRRKHFRHALQSRLKVGQMLRLLEGGTAEPVEHVTPAPDEPVAARPPPAEKPPRKTRNKSIDEDEPQGSLGF